MKILFSALFLLLVSVTSLTQEQKPKSNAQGQPTDKPEVVVVAPSLEEVLASSPLPVPKISLQRALKFAEKYLKKGGANLSLLYLIRAEFTFVGDEKNPAPSWHFLWRREGSTSLLGYDAELYVFMNGRVWDPPVM